MKYLALALLMTLAGCSGTHQAGTTAAAPADPVYPVIVRIVSRHQTIIVSAGPTGAVYSARAADGTQLAVNLTLSELREKQPAIYESIQTGWTTKAEISTIGSVD